MLGLKESEQQEALALNASKGECEPRKQYEEEVKQWEALKRKHILWSRN